MSLWNPTAQAILNYINGVAPLPIVAPLKLYIKTEYESVGPQVITFGGAEYDTRYDGETFETFRFYYATNTNAVVFPNMPERTVSGWFIQDSSTPARTIWEGETLRERTVPAGDSYEVPVGALRVELGV